MQVLCLSAGRKPYLEVQFEPAGGGKLAEIVAFRSGSFKACIIKQVIFEEAFIVKVIADNVARVFYNQVAAIGFKIGRAHV